MRVLRLRKALSELTDSACYSPEKFVPERTLDKWYSKYVDGLKGYSETPGERNSDKFYDWIQEHKRRKVKKYVYDEVIEITRGLSR